MKKQILLLTLITVSATGINAAAGRRAAYEALQKKESSEGTPSSSAVAPTSSATVPTRRSAAPSMPAPSASMPAAVMPTADGLKAAAATNSPDVAAGLAKGLTQQYPSGNANSAAGQAAYSFVVGA